MLRVYSILTSIKYLTRQVHVALEGLPVAQGALHLQEHCLPSPPLYSALLILKTASS